MNALAKERTSAPEFGEDDYDVFHRIGTLTRQLHDALRELGYDIHLQGAAGSPPDARSRLDYIARLTGEAADKVLNAVDGARLEQERQTPPLAGHLHQVPFTVEVGRYYQAADLFLLSSREDPFPSVGLAAPACGLPGVAFAGPPRWGGSCPRGPPG